MSPSVAEGELDGARRVAAAIGIAHETIATDELAREGYRRNAPDRCYFCKTELYESLAALAQQRGYAALLSGANADDAGDWRPGLRAAAEHGVRHPLLDAGAGKAAVRALARALDLPSAEKPATPCLASRIPYGTAVDPAALELIDRAERAVRSLGFPVVRVRHHGILGRVEIAAEDLDRALRARTGARGRRSRRRLSPRRARPRAVSLGPPQRRPRRNLRRMIERAPFGATGHESTRVIFGAAALARGSKRDADRALELLLEHGINHIDVAAGYGDAELRIAHWLRAARGRVLRRHQDRRARLRGRARGDPPLARPARRRPGRPDPAAQPRRRGRLGDRARRRRRAGGRDRGARRGARALHRRHRPRPLGAGDARAQPRALPVRLGALPLQLRPDARPALRRDVGGAGHDVRGAQRRAPDDQEPRARGRGTGATAPRRPGTSRCASRPTSTSRRTGCSAGPGYSSSPRATSRSCRACSTRPSASSRAPRTSRWPRSPRASSRCSSKPRAAPAGRGRRGCAPARSRSRRRRTAASPRRAPRGRGCRRAA